MKIHPDDMPSGSLTGVRRATSAPITLPAQRTYYTLPEPRPFVPAIYPLLLLASTAVAATFCFLYITKPVITAPAKLEAQGPAITRPGGTVARTTAAARSAPPVGASAPAAANMLPNAGSLPGDSAASLTPGHPGQAIPSQVLPGQGDASAFEETNLRVQHILTAESPGGDLSRIVLGVPVLYQTRILAWTEAEIAESRDLLKRLNDYQEKANSLRDEGSRLLAAWNQLIQHSVPTSALRADSPALPENQNPSKSRIQPAELNSRESIQLQPIEP